MRTRAKRLEYEVSLDQDRGLLANGAAPLRLGDEWTAEHLVLAALARCTLASLEFHAEREGVGARGRARASGVVTRRADDGRYAFVEIECSLDVELEPLREGEKLVQLLALAERDCFIGASLTAEPRYEWRVNGNPLR